MNASRYVYLDNAATTKMDPRVIEVMNEHFRSSYGNSSSLHSVGQTAAQTLVKSRETVASLINAKRDEIIFTSSGTESDNIAILGVALKNQNRGKHIITSALEHHAVENTCKSLKRNRNDGTY